MTPNNALERAVKGLWERAAGAQKIIAPAARGPRCARPAQRGRWASLSAFVNEVGTGVFHLMRAAFCPVLIGVLSIVSGCTFIDGPSYEALRPEPSQGKALIVVYRRASIVGDGVRSTLWMDNTLVGKLPIESFITLDVDPGTYHFIAGPKPEKSRLSAVVKAEAGNVYYLRLRRGYVERFREVTSAKAQAELRGMTFIAHPEDA